MSKSRRIWERAPARKDYTSAQNYLSLVLEDRLTTSLIRKLRAATTTVHEAKDVLRASDLPLLDDSDRHVSRDLKSIKKGEKLSPVLLIRGDASQGFPIVIADGYHRICASYIWDENCPIACRIVSVGR